MKLTCSIIGCKDEGQMITLFQREGQEPCQIALCGYHQNQYFEPSPNQPNKTEDKCENCGITTGYLIWFKFLRPRSSDRMEGFLCPKCILERGKE